MRAHKMKCLPAILRLALLVFTLVPSFVCLWVVWHFVVASPAQKPAGGPPRASVVRSGPFTFEQARLYEPERTRLPASAPAAVGQLQVAAAYGKLPLHFEANQGQTDERVKFLARGQGYVLYLTADETVLTVPSPAPRRSKRAADDAVDVRTSENSRPGAVLKIKFVGSNQRSEAEGLEELPGKSNYFIGNDPAKWRTNIPTYARVLFREVYPGVDVAYYGKEGQLEYDLVLAPGTDPNVITLGFEGAEKVELDGAGQLILRTAAGPLIQHAPVIYQETGGRRQAVSGRYVFKAGRQVGFRVGRYDRSRPLIIDPVVLSYATYLGNGPDFGHAIAVDAQGSAYVTGGTLSCALPTTAGSFQPDCNRYPGADVFVMKLNATGSALVYSTYLGGSGNGDNTYSSSDDDVGRGIAVDAAGNAYVTGYTGSLNDFPTTPGAFQTTHAERGQSFGTDAFVTKLNATGSALVYSTYLGGFGFDAAYAIAVDATGNAYVTGLTSSYYVSSSQHFPITPGSFQPTSGGFSSDAFVTKLNPAGSALVYSSYLGGSQHDEGHSIAVDAAGNAYVIGWTDSTNFPTTPGAFQPAHSPSSGRFEDDYFVAKVNPAGSALVYATYLGGSDLEGVVDGNGIAVDAEGNAYVTGLTFSTNFPTTPGAFQRSKSGDYDAFVTKLNPSGTALVYSTYLGRSGREWGNSIAVDAHGNAYVAGQTFSQDFPRVNAFQNTHAGGFFDVFVTKLAPAGDALVYSTLFGGQGDEWGRGIALDGAGNAYVAGYTDSTNLPTTAGAFRATVGAYVPTAYVAKINGLNFTMIPHFVTGGGFVTRVFAKNLTSGNNPLTLQFRNQNGTVASTETLTLAAGQTIERTSGEQSRMDAQATESITLSSEGPISASVLFDCCASGTQVTSAVGVLPQAAGNSFTAPFIFQREVAPNQPLLVEGLAIANTSDQLNTVTIRLFDASGRQLSSDTLPMIAGSGQTALTVSDLPNLGAQLQGKNTFLGSLVITGTQAFAPVIVGNLGGRLFSLPLTAGSGSALNAPATDSGMSEMPGDSPFPAPDEESPSPQLVALEQPQALILPTGATIIPHFVTGGGYVTRLYVKNLGSATTTLILYFLNQNGTLARSETQSLAAGQIFERSSGEANRSAASATQWIALSSAQPISASVLFDCCAAGTTVATAMGVLAQAGATRFTAPFIFQRQTSGQPLLLEGLAIANISDSVNTVTIRLLDQNGSQLSSDTLPSLPVSGQTALTVSDLPNLGAALQGRDNLIGALEIIGTQPFAPVIVGNLGGRLFSLPLTPTQ